MALAALIPWGNVQALVGQELKTLAEVNPFAIARIEEDDLVLTISTGSERRIGRLAFRRAWARIVSGDEISRADLDRIEPRQGTYIAAILAQIPGVGFAYDPVRVFATLPSASEQLGRTATEVKSFLGWATMPSNCPFVDEKKQQLWDTILVGCNRVRSWEDLDHLLLTVMDDYADSRSRAVPRRLRRAAKEFRSA